MQNRTIVTIDSGSNGGIAVFDPVTSIVKAFKMPKEERLLFNFITPKTKVFIEKVNAWGGDREGNSNDPSAIGKRMRMQKLIAHYNKIIGGLDLLGHDYEEVHPLTWQKHFKPMTKGFDKSERKKVYKQVAQSRFHYVKATLNNADALCMMSLALDDFNNLRKAK